jgi:hypothetical protein
VTRARVVASSRHPSFVVLAGVLIAVFTVIRAPFLWYFPRVFMSQDSASYMDVAREIRDGLWPQFVIRTPAYPIFLWAVNSFGDRWLAVVFVQMLLSLAACLLVVWCVREIRPGLAWPATIAMCGMLGSAQVLFYEISILSDSMYASSLAVAAALLILAFVRKSPAPLALASAAMAFAILVRPAGSFLAVIFAIVVAGLAWNRAGWRNIAAFAVPFPSILLALCTYNAATISRFTVNPFGEANLTGATALFWEKDPSLPPAVNRALDGLPASYAELGITAGDLATVRKSWDVDRLFRIYADSYNKLIWSDGWGSGTRFGPGGYIANQRAIRAVCFSAIGRHPALYLKFVWVNLVSFFEGVGYRFDIYSSLRFRARGPLGTRPAGIDLASAAHAAVRPVAESIPSNRDLDHPVVRVQQAWEEVHGFIFQRSAWAAACLIIFAASAAQLIRHRGRHEGAFLLFALTLFPIGASLVVCLVEVASDRYSFPTQFVYYLAAALSPILAAPRLGRARKPAEGR